MKKLNVPILVMCALGAVAAAPVLAQPAIIDPDVTIDIVTGNTPEKRQRKAWDELRRQNAELEKTDPQAAIDNYNAFLEANPKLAPAVGQDFTMTVAGLYHKGLKNPAKAAEIYRWAFAQYKNEPPAVNLLTQHARMLMEAKKPDQAAALLDKHWNDIARTWTHIAVAALEVQGKALGAQNKNDAQIALSEKALLQYPSLLEGRIQNWDGVLYNPLIAALLKAKRFDQALSWARLRFMAAPYDAGAIDRASRMVAQVWTASDPERKALEAFAVAQKDATKHNPLADAKLPVVDAALLQERLKRTAPNADGASDRVILLVSAGALGQAMGEAKTLLGRKETATQGALEAARVFKAADLNLQRANAFLVWLKNPQGASPVDAFIAEQAATRPPVQQ